MVNDLVVVVVVVSMKHVKMTEEPVRYPRIKICFESQKEKNDASLVFCSAFSIEAVVPLSVTICVHRNPLITIIT